MFIAHLPAGYLIARFVSSRLGVEATPRLMIAGMAGGIFPDIDLIYGALADGGRIHHHQYWTHLPMLWLALSIAATFLCRRFQSDRLLAGRFGGRFHKHQIFVFLLGVWSHLFLDSVAGDIWWLWPWLDTPFSLVHVPSIHSPWWLNYLLHWTFSLELATVTLALSLGWRASRRNAATGTRRPSGFPFPGSACLPCAAPGEPQLTEQVEAGVHHSGVETDATPSFDFSQGFVQRQ